ncbi:hypothetical protein MJ563_20495 [Klebsiella pneumoniae]|nr:hypothetical protein MJ563_20495 [Klebsiella pneumoniae]
MRKILCQDLLSARMIRLYCGPLSNRTAFCAEIFGLKALSGDADKSVKWNIADYDAELWQAMEQEKVRQEEHIELIASENHPSARYAGAGLSADQQIC